MKVLRTLGMIAAIGSLTVLTGCTWSVSVKKKIGQPTEVDGTIGGTYPAAVRAMTAAGATLSPIDLYIETAGTDFALDTSGIVAVTLLDGNGSILTAKSFSWVRVGTKIEFQNPTAVQSWLNSYPAAQDVKYNLTAGATPVDGNDHVMSTAVVYNATTQAAATATFPAQCYTRYHTVSICAQ